MAFHSFRFSYRRRMKTALYPLVLAAILLGVHARWVRVGSWVSLALFATIALLLVRAAQWLLGGRHPVQMDDQGVLRGGPRVPWRGAEVHLRARHAGAGALRLDEAVIFTPTDEKGQRFGVSFDVSLIGFEQAVEVLLEHVPEARVKVWAPGGKSVSGQERADVLAPYQSEINRALTQAGRGSLGAPPGKLGPPPQG